ncbi:MAG: type II toxin-antitoxin system Phd/YefM family antitoxin [Clostridia bacterium]|nr:type II toxin-antitoxin system Phd/YefM family antitoxin [Clostridia bacterium]
MLERLAVSAVIDVIARTAVILKNNIPRYLVIDFSKADNDVVAPSEDVMIISKRLIEKNRKAYEVLAK